jgi:hypothetical protein
MSLFELTFGLEPITKVNKSADLDIKHSEDFCTKLYQKIWDCQQMARKTAREANDETIEKSVEYYNS